MGKRLPHGAIVAFEGIDGAGKTTQAHRLVEAVRAAGLPALYTREPTDGPWGQKIRRSAESERMSMEDELHAFVEDRREHVRDLLRPALDSGVLVVLDRYYFSNAAYQGARGADPAEIIRSNEAFSPVPDLLVFVDTPVPVAMERIRARGIAVTAFERAEALERSAQIFRSIARPYILRLDGRRSIDELAGDVLDVVARDLLTTAVEVDAGRPSPPPDQIAAAMAEVQSIQLDVAIPPHAKAEAVRRALRSLVGDPQPS
jgi:dTMP kinase